MLAFEPRSGRVEFVVDRVALGRVFYEYFGFLCQFSFHRLLHTHHLPSGTGTIGQVVADVPSGLSLNPPHSKKQKKKLTILHTAILQNAHYRVQPKVDKLCVFSFLSSGIVF
jgi:hypothetical protein